MRHVVSGVLLCLFAHATTGQSDAGHGSALPEGLTDSDWSSIHAAYEDGLHRVYEDDGVHLARNPGQQWTTTFDGRGAMTVPDGGGWTWGLELASWGCVGEAQLVTVPRTVMADGQRVAYVWDEQLTEWYINDGRGLEHGFTVNTRPAGVAGELIFDLATRGGLDATVSGDGRNVNFSDAAGGSVLIYAGLTVFDVDGRTLSARFESSSLGLRLTVDDQDAHYPLTIDPVAQQAYLKASNTGKEDGFGNGVAISGDSIVVGAGFEDSAATGVNGFQANHSAVDSGAAYVFVRNGTTWSQQAYLKAFNPLLLDRGFTDSGSPGLQSAEFSASSLASDANAYDFFGRSVAISGDTIVVGAQREDSSATGVNGDQGDNSGPDSGAAYVYVRNGTTWAPQAYLKASNTDFNDGFGEVVSISGDTIVVSTQHEDSSATGVDGDGSDNSADIAGAAYVFVRSGSTWSQQAYLKASNTDAFDRFGYSVSVSGDTVVVGALIEGSNATGVDGDQGNGADGSGAAYVFVRSGSTWSQQAYLKASNTEAWDLFGNDVSISGGTIFVTARSEGSSATGVDGDQSDNSAEGSGAVYVFVRNGATWSQQAYLKASNTEARDGFGGGLSICGDTAVVGAGGEDSKEPGVDGDQSNNAVLDAGAAYVFVRNGTTWSQLAYLKASTTGERNFFGSAVSVSGNTVIVGARAESGSATGVDGDQGNTDAYQSGAAYVFDLDLGLDLDLDPWTGLGQGLAGTHGDPLLVGSGTLLLGDPVTLALTNALESTTTYFVIGVSSVNLPFNGGTLVPAFEVPFGLFLVLPTNASGELLLSDTWPGGIPGGTELYFQHWIVDAGGPFGFAASNAVRGTVP